MPILISRTGGVTKIIACMAIGANRRTTSERKTTLVNTSREIARSSLGCVGDARAGVFGIKKERATLTDTKDRVMTLGPWMAYVRTREQRKHVWQCPAHPEWQVGLRTGKQGPQESRRPS